MLFFKGSVAILRIERALHEKGLHLETAATQDGKIHTVTQLGIAYIITLMTWISVFHSSKQGYY